MLNIALTGVFKMNQKRLQSVGKFCTTGGSGGSDKYELYTTHVSMMYYAGVNISHYLNLGWYVFIE